MDYTFRKYTKFAMLVKTAEICKKPIKKDQKALGFK